MFFSFFCQNFTNTGLNLLPYWDFIFYCFTYGNLAILALVCPFLYKKLKVGLKPILYLTLGVCIEFFGVLFILLAAKLAPLGWVQDEPPQKTDEQPVETLPLGTGGEDVILKAYSFQVIMPTIIATMPLASVFAFLISRFNKKLIEYHPAKTYAIRFAAIFTITFGLIMLNI